MAERENQPKRGNGFPGEPAPDLWNDDNLEPLKDVDLSFPSVDGDDTAVNLSGSPVMLPSSPVVPVLTQHAMAESAADATHVDTTPANDTASAVSENDSAADTMIIKPASDEPASGESAAGAAYDEPTSGGPVMKPAGHERANDTDNLDRPTLGKPVVPPANHGPALGGPAAEAANSGLATPESADSEPSGGVVADEPGLPLSVLVPGENPDEPDTPSPSDQNAETQLLFAPGTVANDAAFGASAGAGATQPLFPADDQSEELVQPVVTDEAIPSDAVLPPEQAKRKRIIVIAAVVAVVVIAAAAGGAVWLNSRRDGQELKSNLATCQSAYASYRTATEDLQTALAKGKQTQSVTASQVADATTLSTLKKAVAAAEEHTQNAKDVEQCSGSAGESVLGRQATAAKTAADESSKLVQSLTKATDAVTGSKAKKTKADTDAAKKQLQDAVKDAQNLLADSEGDVADETTRQTLQTALDAANKALQQSKPDVKTLQKALADLQTAVDGVNNSLLTPVSSGQTSGTTNNRTSGGTATGGQTNNSQNTQNSQNNQGGTTTQQQGQQQTTPQQPTTPTTPTTPTPTPDTPQPEPTPEPKPEPEPETPVNPGIGGAGA